MVNPIFESTLRSFSTMFMTEPAECPPNEQADAWDESDAMQVIQGAVDDQVQRGGAE